MGFRFRRSIRLAPGLRINLSKSGASLSVGKRGATMNFSLKGKKTTIGLPGTGMSYSTRSPWQDADERRSLPTSSPAHTAAPEPVPAPLPPQSEPAPLITPPSERGVNKLLGATIAVIIAATALAYLIH